MFEVTFYQYVLLICFDFWHSS